MPIYHFHISDGHKLHDPRGVDLPSDDVACRYGEQLAQGYAPITRALTGDSKTFVEVVNEAGATLARLLVPDE